MKNYNQFIKENSNEYETIASTSKYSLVKIPSGYRIENINGLYKKEVPYIEIPKSLADEFIEYLVDYKYLEITKTEGKNLFDEYCRGMFDDEHTVLCPNDVK